jgi:hypothetical protein
MSEMRLARFLDEIFEDLTYTIECRSRTCKLMVEEDLATWIDVFQAEAAERALTASQTWTLHGAQTIVLAEEPRSRGVLLNRTVSKRINESKSVADCRRRFPAGGDLLVVIDIEGANRFAVALRGSLVGTELAECVRLAVESELSQVPIPRDTVLDDQTREFQIVP